MIYLLKHRDDVAAILSIDEETHHLLRMDVVEENRRWLPFLGSADRKKMSVWIRNRSIPATRHQIEELLREAGCRSVSEYLFKNLALSVTDSYWILPAELDLSWKDVSPFRHFWGRRMIVHNESSYSPNASLGGQLRKYADWKEDQPVLIKKAKASYGLQCFNEVFASRIHAGQGWREYVPYQAAYDPKDDSFTCECPLFTTEEVEFIPAYEILLSGKQPGSVSGYDWFVRRCGENGLQNAGKFMDYMTLSDFLITNTDRHLYNFGILRHAVSGEVLRMAPIFDSGNSMFYNQIHTRPLTRKEILGIEITGIHAKEEQMLRHVKERDLFAPERALLPEEVRDFYREAGVPVQIAEGLSKNYETKCQMLREFQSGKPVSLYNEKSKMH